MRTAGRLTFTAVGAGLLVGALTVVLWARPVQIDLGGLCLAPSPLQTFAAAARPCQRIALNLVTLPYITGAVLLLPRLPARLALRAAHVLVAVAPVTVLAAVLLERRDSWMVVSLGVLAATLLTGALHLLPGRRRLVHAAHLGLAALWLVLAVGSNLAVSLAGR